MKNTGMASAVLTIVLITCGGAQAQKLVPKSAPVTMAPDLTKLNIEKILQQLRTATVQPGDPNLKVIPGLTAVRMSNAVVTLCYRGEALGKNLAEKRHRRAGVGQLPAHDHHEAEADEQENPGGDQVLKTDDLVVERPDVLLREGQLVVDGVVHVDPRPRRTLGAP